MIDGDDLDFLRVWGCIAWAERRHVIHFEGVAKVNDRDLEARYIYMYIVYR